MKSHGPGPGWAQATLCLGSRLGFGEMQTTGSQKLSLNQGMQAEPSLNITSSDVLALAQSQKPGQTKHNRPSQSQAMSLAYLDLWL